MATVLGRWYQAVKTLTPRLRALTAGESLIKRRKRRHEISIAAEVWPKEEEDEGKERAVCKGHNDDDDDEAPSGRKYRVCTDVYRVRTSAGWQ